MKFFKLATAAALVAASFTASAMTTIADDQLSTIAGQDGVSIAANLNINIGSFTYTDNGGLAGNGSVSFDGIHIGGLVAMTIDILSAGAFQAGVLTPFVSATGGGTTAANGFETTVLAPVQNLAGGTVGTYYTGTDVVQFAFPNVGINSSAELISISVDAIRMGTNGVASATNPSFGSFSMSGLDLRGTTVWMWAH